MYVWRWYGGGTGRSLSELGHVASPPLPFPHCEIVGGFVTEAANCEENKFMSTFPSAAAAGKSDPERVGGWMDDERRDVRGDIIVAFGIYGIGFLADAPFRIPRMHGAQFRAIHR